MTLVQNETGIEENTAIGYKVLYIGVNDPDINENITWELTGDHTLFTMGELKYGYGKMYFLLEKFGNIF